MVASVAPVLAQTNAVIPFEFKRGQIVLPARVNDAGPFSLMLDTGYSLTMLHPESDELAICPMPCRIAVSTSFSPR